MTEQDIFTLSSDVVDRYAALQPELASLLGLPGDHGAWSDHSPDGYAAQAEFWRSTLDAARTATAEGATGRVAAAVLVDEAETNLERIERRLHVADLNNIASPWQSLRETFDMMADATEDDWDAIVRRLDGIATPLAEYRTCLEEGVAERTVASARQTRAAIDQGRTSAGDDGPFALLRDRLAAAELDDVARTRIAPRLDAAIATAQAAYGDMTDWLESSYLPVSEPHDGVGRERYAVAARDHLGADIDLDETYAWGWEEIARLTTRLDELCRLIDPDASSDEVIERLNTDPAYAADDEAAFLRLMDERQQRALVELDGAHFTVPEPVRTLEVRAAPPGGALAPYYLPPSEDFSRPGRVHYPMEGRDRFPLFEEISTAYHEGFPGHHLQVGWQQCLGDDISRFHRLLVWNPGSGEGWALYAEHLMGELGYFERPEYELGMVVSQLFRSCRIVIDIGSHCGLPIPTDQPFHPGESWSYELGVEMMQAIGRQTAAMAESEVVRYLGWPGQAISYKCGERVILDLRRQLVDEGELPLGEFHAAVLSAGSVGLDLLERLVRDDVAAGGGVRPT